MQNDLQILEEKFKDIKARLGAAIAIIEEAERVFSRVRREAGRLNDDESSFVEFVKNEISDAGQSIRENSIVDASDGQLIHQVSKAAALDILSSKQELRAEPIYQYLNSLGGAAAINQIWDRFFNDYEWNFGSMESAIRADSRFAFRAEGVEDIVFLNESRVATTAPAQKPIKRLTSEDILKYLQKKPEGATLKQIQSRFKGYCNNSCMDIFNMAVSYDGFLVEDNVHLSKTKVCVAGVSKDAETFLRVRSILVDRLDVDEKLVEASSRIVEDFGADSLDAVELLMDIEEEFYIDVPDEDAEKIQTVGDVVRYIDGRLGELKYGDGR